MYIDGHDVKEVSIESLRRQMGIMTQLVARNIEVGIAPIWRSVL